jgi:pyruvate dehydrogenase E1 component alpha subunit
MQVPVGAGFGLAHKMKGEKSCAFAIYGDGAANQGQVAEALNLSALWELPVIFVCENNHYGMGTAEWRSSKSATYFKRGDYVPGIRVDGMDALAMKQATIWAKQFVLEKGPLILEADTYRCVLTYSLMHLQHQPQPPAVKRKDESVRGV